jgi:NAD(P)-dependent dehydrogenase (short-subunit alcohol dehydrogenase family)
MVEVVVVTGGSAGVGRSTAEAFARRGASIALVARGSERLESAAEAVRRLGGRALPLQVDVAEHDAVDDAAERIERELGPVGVWVNNAMATVFSPLERIAPEEYRRATEVTYLGSVWGTMAALRRMVPRDAGVVVQVGSALAYRGIPLQSPYCGAKHALQGFTESTRTELMHAGSRVWLTMVQLPALNTPQFEWGRTKLANHPQPVPPIYQPEVAAEAIVWAAGHRRREVFVGWPTVRTIVGNALAPGLADGYLARTGFSSQLLDERISPDRPDNLFEPVPGDWGAHGRFSDQARGRSLQLALTKRRRALASGAVALGALALARRGRRR